MEPGTNGSRGTDVAGATTLKRNALTMPETLAQSVANAAPSAAMALLPLLVFLNAGNGTWFAFVVALGLMLCIGYCAAQFARRMNSAGSFYVWVTQALGPAAGHTAGWALLLGYIFTGVATVYGFGIFAGDLSHRVFGVDPLYPLMLVVLFAIEAALAAAVAIYDINLSARTSLVLESISVLAILTLCIAVWVIRGPIDTSQLSFKGVVPGGVVIGVVLAIFAFVGFESAGSLGMEAKDPFRNVARAIITSAILVGAFYVIVSYSQTLGFQPTNGGYAKSSAPMPDLAVLLGLGWLAIIIDIGISISMFACTLACINAAARMAMTMAHDGMGVPALKRTHPTRKTPTAAIVTVAVPMLAVPFLTSFLRQSPVDSTGWTGTLATFGFMLAYALVALGAPVYLRRIKQATAVVWVLGMIGLVSMIVVFYASWLPQTIPVISFPPLTGIYVWLPYMWMAWTAIGLIWYFTVRSRTPDVASGIGSRFHSVETHEAEAQEAARVG